MVTGKKNLRYLLTVKNRGACILWILQKPRGYTFLFIAFLIGKNARNKPCCCIHYYASRNFATCQNIITNRNFLINNFINHALVNALIVSAKNNNVIILI